MPQVPLLSNYLEGRRDGPVFVTDRGAKADAYVGPPDRDERGRARLSYERAEALFRDWSAAVLGKSATLHQLRRSPTTPEDGASAPMLMTKSGHTSIRTLGKYARPGTEALARWQQETDRSRRGRDSPRRQGKPPAGRSDFQALRGSLMIQDNASVATRRLSARR